jgi:hypothetical protein
LGSAEAKAIRRRAERHPPKTWLKSAIKGASKSAVADFDQPTAGRMRPPRPSPRRLRLGEGPLN